MTGKTKTTKEGGINPDSLPLIEYDSIDIEDMCNEAANLEGIAYGGLLLSSPKVEEFFIQSSEDDPTGKQFAKIGEHEAKLIMIRARLDGVLHQLRSAERYYWLRTVQETLFLMDKGSLDYDSFGKTDNSRKDNCEAMAYSYCKENPYWEIRHVRRATEDTLKMVNASLAALEQLMKREMDRIKYLEFAREETYGF